MLREQTAIPRAAVAGRDALSQRSGATNASLWRTSRTSFATSPGMSAVKSAVHPSADTSAVRTQEPALASAVTAPESRCQAYTHSPTPSNGRGKLLADVQKTTVRRPSAEIPASVTVLFG